MPNIVHRQLHAHVAPRRPLATWLSRSGPLCGSVVAVSLHEHSAITPSISRFSRSGRASAARHCSGRGENTGGGMMMSGGNSSASSSSSCIGTSSPISGGGNGESIAGTYVQALQGRRINCGHRSLEHWPGRRDGTSQLYRRWPKHAVQVQCLGRRCAEDLHVHSPSVTFDLRRLL